MRKNEFMLHGPSYYATHSARARARVFSAGLLLPAMPAMRPEKWALVLELHIGVRLVECSLSPSASSIFIFGRPWLRCLLLLGWISPALDRQRIDRVQQPQIVDAIVEAFWHILERL